jgi:hypothetical protein
LPANRSETSPKFSVFVSYSKQDQERAQAIAESLEERGVTCWIAPRDVRPGRSYGDEIISGIERSLCFLLVLSESSNNSAFVAREVERAISKNKPIFTVRVDDVTPSPALELFISGTQWIDAFSARLDSHIDKLASLLEAEEAARVPSSPRKRQARASLRRPAGLRLGCLPPGASLSARRWPPPSSLSHGSEATKFRWSRPQI